ncbi:site-2 protease family protein [Cytobacillus sp. IB215665]|uniref:site-2 protease family protein n=1 Tax=Cytobacillus sp. IB215665 TaxID=3097357 RepID=UPI002A123B69|nr:site-2 protease family protein [Cytobacillus sp. IB215665]MDX8367125.1 hypothetical protein [Cytobacillus sp. IB215665]
MKPVSAIPLFIMVIYVLSLIMDFQENFYRGIFLLLSMFVFLLLHEIGHVIAGKIAGFDFEFVILGPIKIYKSNGKLKIFQNDNWELAGGVTRSYLTNKTKIRKKLIIYTAGGPLISIMLATLFLTLGSIFNIEFLNTFFLINILISLATLLPLGDENNKTDGKELLTLLKNDLNTKKYLNTFLIMNELLSVRRPKDWDIKTVEYLKNNLMTSDNSFEYKEHVHTLIYYQGMDVDTNEERLLTLKELMRFDPSKDLKEILNSSRIMVEFLNSQNNLDYYKLKSLYSKLDPSNNVNEYGFLRAKCIIDFLDGELQTAKKELNKLNTLQQDLFNVTIVNPGYFILENELLDELKTKIKIGSVRE